METKAIKDSQSFCSYCRISLNTKQERILGYHEACASEMASFKEEMGVWYYLQLVNATDADYEADANGNIIGLDLSNKRLFDIPELPFQDLRVLDLSYNHLSAVPAWIFNLPNLETIIFPGNGFSQSLVYDMLRLNEQGVNVVSTGLKFYDNRLTSINFTYVGSYMGIHLLDFPLEISSYFDSALTVNISHNGLRRFPQWLFTVTGLRDLIIAGNQFSTSELRKLKDFSDLRSVKMSIANLTRDQRNIIEDLESNGVEVSNYESRSYWWVNENDF